SGLHANCCTPLEASVTRRGSPPRIDITQTCRLASFSLEALARKARRSPAGDQCGEARPRRSYTRGRWPPLATSTIPSSGSHRLSLEFARDTMRATEVPSGEISGLDGTAIRKRSAGWKRSATRGAAARRAGNTRDQGRSGRRTPAIVGTLVRWVKKPRSLQK